MSVKAHTYRGVSLGGCMEEGVTEGLHARSMLKHAWLPGSVVTALRPDYATPPCRYQPPNLAISTLYWKAWPLLLVVAAFNPENIGGSLADTPHPRDLLAGTLVWWDPWLDWAGLWVLLLATAGMALLPRFGRLGGVPHTEDAHGDGDDQVRIWGHSAHGVSRSQPSPTKHPHLFICKRTAYVS